MLSFNPDTHQIVSKRKLTLLLDAAQVTKEKIEQMAKRRNYKGLKQWEKKLLALANKALKEKDL